MAISAPEADELLDRLTAFMDTHIYPNEEAYVTQLNGLEDRFSTVPLMEELKAKAREAGLWNLCKIFLCHDRARCGFQRCYQCPDQH